MEMLAGLMLGGWRRLGRRPRLRAAAIVATALVMTTLAAAVGQAQDMRFFRIGTGSSAGTYFPIGSIIASAISNPPGSRECERGGSCGVPGMIAVAQSTNGSVANIDGIKGGSLESGLSQADVAYWAYHGDGIYAETGPAENLRAIANLYPETIHLVVRRDSDIHSIADLKGKRISLDREGSGTRVDALLILDAYGLSPDAIQAESLGVGPAADKLRAGELDGFFLVAGTPTNAVKELANDNLIRLLPIEGPEAEALRADYPFFAVDSIPSGTYLNVPLTPTLSVGAQWMTSALLSDELIYEITRALWNDNTRRLLDDSHPKGKLIRLETALDGLGVPLHPGAARYYEEQGLVPATTLDGPAADPARESQ